MGCTRCSCNTPTAGSISRYCVLPRFRHNFRLAAQPCFGRVTGRSGLLSVPSQQAAVSRKCRSAVMDAGSSSGSAAESTAVRSESEYRARTIEEYEQLKGRLLQRSGRFTAYLAVYLLLVGNVQVAGLSLLGGGGSYLYLLWLMRDVDAVQPGDRVPMKEWVAGQQGPLLRNLLKLAAAYSHSLKPRLLVLVALFAATWAYDHSGLAAEPVGPLDLAALLGGFASYKVALGQQLWDDNTPRFDPEAAERPPRPRLPEIEDISVDLKQLMTKKNVAPDNTGGRPSNTKE